MPTQSVENGDGKVILKPLENKVYLDRTNGDGTSSQMLRDEGPTVLETAEERRARRRSHYVIYVTTFVTSIGFSIVLTGVWPYLQKLDSTVSKEFLGWVVAANPMGQMLASPACGFWANKAGSNRSAMVLTITFFIVGNILYAILSLFGSAARVMIIVSRVIVGVSSANIAICRSYIAASTTLQERTSGVSFLAVSQGLGYIVGPAIQTAIAFGFTREEAEEEAGNKTSYEYLRYELEDTGPRVEWNMFTATGWFAALIGFLNLFLFLPSIYQELPIIEKEADIQRQRAKKHHRKLPNPDYLLVVIMLKTYFFTGILFVLLETIMSPMVMDMYAWSDEKAVKVIGIGWSIFAVIFLMMVTSLSFLTKRFDERKILIIIGLLPLWLSTFCYFPMGSTYPKIKNCTSRYEPGINSALNSTTHFFNDTEGMVAKLPFNESAPEELALELGMLDDVNLVESMMNNTLPSQFNSNMLKGRRSDHTTLPKERRSIAWDGVCFDLGCPTEQIWCQYTPIIEQTQLVIGFAASVLGYAIAFALSNSLISKLLGPKPQGVWMGVLTSVGSLSRIIGPIFMSYVYTALGTRWVFGICFCIFGMTLIIVSLFFKRLVPMKVI